MYDIGGFNILHPLIICCGVVDQLTGFREPGAMAGTIPGMLCLVIFQSAPKMGTAGDSGRKQTKCGFQSIDCQLWVQNTPRRGENLGVLIGLPLYQVG